MTIILTDGKVTANKSTLNLLAIAFGETEMRYEEKGLFALARLMGENHDRIYNALEECGYYEEE